MLKTTDNQTLLAGVNAVGVVSLLAYTLRTFNEVNSNIDELRNEMESFRKNYVIIILLTFLLNSLLISSASAGII